MPLGFFVFIGMGKFGDNEVRGRAASRELHACVLILYCALIRMEKEKKKKQQLRHRRRSAHLRGPGEPARGEKKEKKETLTITSGPRGVSHHSYTSSRS